MPKPFNQPKNILVMRYRFIGDTLLSVPFLRNLRQAYPEANIDMLVAPNSGEILKYCPYINHLIYFDTTRKHQYEYKEDEEARSFFSYISQLKSNQYDTAFVLKRSFSSALLAFLAGIPQRIGYDTEARKLLLTHPLPYEKNKPETECFLDALRAVDIPIKDNHLESWWSDKEEQYINELTRDLDPALSQNKTKGCHILFHMTSSNAEKEWPEGLFFHLAQWLIENFNATIHCVGASSDASRYHNLSKTINSPESTRFYNWCGKTDLLESMSLIKRMQLVVGVDSGTLHMASAAKIPTLGLFNPENIEKWAPSGPDSAIISERDPYESLPKVQDACQKLLQQKTPAH